MSNKPIHQIYAPKAWPNCIFLEPFTYRSCEAHQSRVLLEYRHDGLQHGALRTCGNNASTSVPTCSDANTRHASPSPCMSTNSKPGIWTRIPFWLWVGDCLNSVSPVVESASSVWCLGDFISNHSHHVAPTRWPHHCRAEINRWGSHHLWHQN